MKNQYSFEKIKKMMNRKILLGVTSLFICVILIGICSFVPFIIDPSQWQTTEFLTDELIVVAIIIFSMVAAIMIGQVSNGQNEESNLAKSRVAFFESKKNVTNINAFNQWVKKVLQPNDIKSMKLRLLRKVGIEDLSILELEDTEIKALLNTPQKYNERYYKGLSEEQIKVILDIKKGKHRIQLVEPEYYLSVKNLIDPRTITERSSKEGVKKSLYLARSVIARSLLAVLTAMIFASLMRDTMATGDFATAIMKFMSRLWALISSAFMGYFVGCQINDIDAEYIDMRVTVHKMFLQDKDFVPKDEQEEARDAFIERIKKENSTLLLEHNNNVIREKEI